MASRDVEINLIGHDRTGRATRSAANNLDQLARKVSKFEAANENTAATVDKQEAALAKLRKTANVTSSNLDRLRGAEQRLMAVMDRKTAAVKRQDAALAKLRKTAGATGSALDGVDDAEVNVNVDRSALGRIRALGTAAGNLFTRAMSNAINDGSRAIGNALRAVLTRMPALQVFAAVFAARLLGLIGQALTAGMGLLLGPALLAAPIAFLLKKQLDAAKQVETSEKRIASLKKRLEAAKSKDVQARLRKEIAAEQRILAEHQKQAESWNRLKSRAKSFMEFISAPLKLPLRDALDEIGDGLNRLKKPMRNITEALGPALAPFTKGIMNALVGFIKALEPAMPGIVAGMQAWGKEAPKIGKAFGDMIAKIMEDPEGVVDAISSISGVLQDLATISGAIVSGLTKIGNAFFEFETKMNELEGGEKLSGSFESGFAGIGQATVDGLNKADTTITAKITQLRTKLGAWLRGTLTDAKLSLTTNLASFTDSLGLEGAGREAKNSFVRGMSGVGADVARVWNSVITFFTPFGLRLSAFLRGAATDAKLSFLTGMGGVAQDVIRVWNSVIAFFASLPGRISGFFNRIVAQMGGLPSAIGVKLATLPLVVMAPFNALAARAAGAARSLVTRVVGALQGLPGRAAAAVAGFAGRVTAGISSAAGRAAASARSLVSRVVGALASLAGRARGAIAALPGRIGSVISAAASRAATGARNLVNRVAGALRGLPGRARGAIAGLPGRVGSVMSAAASRATSVARTLVARVVGALRTLPGRAGAAVAAAPGRIAGVLRRAIGGARAAASAIVNAFVSVLRTLPGRAAAALSGVGSRIAGVLSGALARARAGVSAIRSTLGGVTNSAASGAWQGALAGGSGYRTEPARVNVEAPNVSTRVFLDSREIAAVVRSTITDENRRNAHRARVGRRN